MNNPFRRYAFLRRLMVPVALALPLMSPSPAGAREYDPYIMYVFPAGGQRGTTVEGIMARGRGLEGTSEIRISGGGVTGKVVAIEEPSTQLQQRSQNRQDQAENPNVVKFSVTIAPDAELGERDLWLITPKGATNRFHFVVGQIPEVNQADEDESNGEAQPLGSLPILVNGQYNQGDHDVFRFTAKAGQILVCEVQAQKLVPYIADAVPGWFQPSLTLYDATGKELEYVDDFHFHPDPLLIYSVEKDGEYLIEIKDALFRGREDLIYRLSIGALPYVTHIYPLGGQRASDAQVELHGVNLTTASMNFALPGDAPPSRQIQVTSNGLTSNAIRFVVGDIPETAEAEPNDAVDQANKVQVPVILNGRVQQSGDADHFTFSASKGQKLVMDVRARRLDSPLDSIITLLTTAGGQLAENDDTEDLSEGLITHHADSYLSYTFQADGDYVLRLGDVQAQGGGEYAYRLRITPPRQDFDLRVFPANFSVAQGATALAKIKAYRRDGFNDQIDVAIEGLPSRFLASPLTIPQGQNEARFTVTAPADAALGILSPTVGGTATIVDKEAQAEKKAAGEALAKIKGDLGKANTEYEAAEKAAGEAEAAAKAVAEDAGKSEEEKKATADAAAKRKAADEAKANRDKLAGDETAANARVAEADKRPDSATIHRQAIPAEELMQAFYYWHDVPTKEFLLAVVKPASFALSTNTPSTEVHEVLQDAELSVVVKASREGLQVPVARAEAEKKAEDEALAKVKADLAKAKTDYAAAEKAAREAKPDEAAGLRAKATAAKATLDKLVADEKAANAKVAEAKKNVDDAQQAAKGPISLKADTPPKGVTVKTANIPADQTEATVTIKVTKQVPVGFMQNIIITGSVRAGKDTIMRTAPAIPIRVVAPPEKAAPAK